jgi:nicotinate-nucleotide adenylyltransferase
VTAERRIGILGGTFNPIHIAHLIIAEAARESYHLHKVLFIPSANPPHKEDEEIIAASHRYRLVSLAIADNPFFELSDIEMKREGRSYSVETLHDLRDHDTEPTDYFFIIGADSVPELCTWRNIEELATLCTFLVAPRPGWDVEHLALMNLGLPDWLKHQLLANVVPVPPIGISSTEIRDRIQKGLSIRYLVPGAAEEYIAQHNLFRVTDNSA